MQQQTHEQPIAQPIRGEQNEQRLLNIVSELETKITASARILEREVGANKQLDVEYRRLQEKATERDYAEREKKAEILRTTIIQKQESDDKAIRQQHIQNYENLKQHIEHQITQVDAAFAAAEKAITEKNKANDEHFAHINGLQGQLRELSYKMATIKELEVKTLAFDASLALAAKTSEQRDSRLTAEIKTSEERSTTRTDETTKEANRRIAVLEGQATSIRALVGAGVVGIPVVVFLVNFFFST